jgi:hypothetical protein
METRLPAVPSKPEQPPGTCSRSTLSHVWADLGVDGAQRASLQRSRARVGSLMTPPCTTPRLPRLAAAWCRRGPTSAGSPSSMPPAPRRHAASGAERIEVQAENQYLERRPPPIARQGPPSTNGSSGCWLVSRQRGAGAAGESSVSCLTRPSRGASQVAGDR